MTTHDTSREAVERAERETRLAAAVDHAEQINRRDPGVREPVLTLYARDLRALLAERDALRAEVERLNANVADLCRQLGPLPPVAVPAPEPRHD